MCEEVRIGGYTASQEEIIELRAEVECLREENNSLQKTIVVVVTENARLRLLTVPTVENQQPVDDPTK